MISALALVAWLALMFHVRGRPVAAPAPHRIDELLAALIGGGLTIGSQADIDRVGAVAASLVAEEGLRPGPFYVLHLSQLDYIEKFHHLMHQPFTGIRRMYCDIWIHSVTTYGAAQATWGRGEVLVRPALELPILLFLLDRLARERDALGEYSGAVFEAFGGMEMHTVPGRARLWQRVLAAAVRHPRMAPWIAVQLDAADPRWADSAETRFWRELAGEPTLTRLDALAERATPRPGLQPHGAPVDHRAPAPAAGTPAGRAFAALLDELTRQR
jgi:hypothetical protein